MNHTTYNKIIVFTGLHYIIVEHDDCKVDGSPFKVYVSCGADDDMYVEGDALHHTMPRRYSEFIIKNAKTGEELLE